MPSTLTRQKYRQKDLKKFIKAMRSKNLPRHVIAEMLLYLDGRPLNLSKYGLFYPLYNVETPRAIYLTGRQVTKSSTLANVQVLTCSLRPYFKSMYAAPVEKQVNRYSSLYIKPRLIHSPYIKKYFVGSSNQNNVKMRQLANGSVMHFVHVLNSADSARGISVDEVNWDEVQDIDHGVLAVVKECTSASEYGNQRFCGTAKTLDNLIEALWLQSSQCEWVMKCHHCGHLNIPVLPDVLKMIRPAGPSCVKCEKVLDVTIGEWVAGNPSIHDFFPGYHVPQIIAPLNTTEKRWREIHHNFLTYPRAQFINEVLGISYDQGGKILTLSELKELCVLDYNPKGFRKEKYAYTVQGVDWAISASQSFTVTVILGVLHDGRCELIDFKLWNDTDILEQIKDICNIASTYNVDMICCDFGVGHTNNMILKQKYNPNRVIEFQYTGGTVFCRRQNNAPWYMLQRTQSMNQTFVDMKDGKILLPKYDSCKVVCNHIMSIYEDITTSTSGSRKVFRKNPSIPDDYFHAINFAYTGARRLMGKFEVVMDAPNEYF